MREGSTEPDGRQFFNKLEEFVHCRFSLFELISNLMNLPPVLQNSYRLLRQAIEEYNKDNVPRLGAAIAYYTAFSLADDTRR